MKHTGGFSANFRLHASIVFIGLTFSARGQDGVPPYPYLPANCKSHTLTVFPPAGTTRLVPLPPDFMCIGFSLDGKSVFAEPAKGDPRNLVRIEFNPTRVSVANSPFSMQGNRSPDGKWVADFENSKRGKLVLIDAHDPSRARILGRGGTMKPAWSPDSRYLLLEKWQWHCGVNLDVEVPETLETLDMKSRKRSTIRSSRCQIQGGVNGFVSSEIAP